MSRHRVIQGAGLGAPAPAAGGAEPFARVVLLGRERPEVVPAGAARPPIDWHRMPLPGSVPARFVPALALAGILATAQGARSQVVLDCSELLQHFDLWWELNYTTLLPRPPIDPIAVAALRDKAIPALCAALRDSKNHDVTSSAMVALARIVPAAADPDLTGLFRARLSGGSSMVRDDAALALGISGRKDALDLLVALAADQPAARIACATDAVVLRTRVFAVYGLGCCAETANEPAAQIRIGGAAIMMLGEPGDQLELRIAAVSALSLLRLDAEHPVQRGLLLTTIGRLADLVASVSTGEDPRLLAHVPPALARLERGARGTHADVAAAFAAQREAWRKDAAKRLSAPAAEDLLLQSEILALGDALDQASFARGARAAEVEATAELFAKAREAADVQARYFALLGLGRLGGTTARTSLLETAAGSPGSTQRNWLLLALGLLEHHRRVAAGPDWLPDPEIRAAISRQGTGRDNPAWPLAVGLARTEQAVEQLTAALQAGTGDVCDGLALAGAKESIPVLRTVLARKKLPHDFEHFARASALLGDEQFGHLLQQRLDAAVQGSANLAEWAALCMGTECHPGTAATLIRALGQQDLEPLMRAFAAQSLGRMLERDGPHAFTRLGVGCNYCATVPTLLEQKDGILDHR